MNSITLRPRSSDSWNWPPNKSVPSRTCFAVWGKFESVFPGSRTSPPCWRPSRKSRAVQGEPPSAIVSAATLWLIPAVASALSGNAIQRPSSMRIPIACSAPYGHIYRRPYGIRVALLFLQRAPPCWKRKNRAHRGRPAPIRHHERGWAAARRKDLPSAGRHGKRSRHSCGRRTRRAGCRPLVHLAGAARGVGHQPLLTLSEGLPRPRNCELRHILIRYNAQIR